MKRKIHSSNSATWFGPALIFAGIAGFIALELDVFSLANFNKPTSQTPKVETSLKQTHQKIEAHMNTLKSMSEDIEDLSKTLQELRAEASKIQNKLAPGPGSGELPSNGAIAEEITSQSLFDAGSFYMRQSQIRKLSNSLLIHKNAANEILLSTPINSNYDPLIEERKRVLRNELNAQIARRNLNYRVRAYLNPEQKSADLKIIFTKNQELRNPAGNSL